MALTSQAFVLPSPVGHSPSRQLRGVASTLPSSPDATIAHSSEGSASWLMGGVATAVTSVAAGALTRSAVKKSRKTRQIVVGMQAKGPVDIEEKRFPILTKRPPVGSFPKLPPEVHPGVVTGKCLEKLLDWAKENEVAIPAVNCVSSSSINACLEAAREMDAPIMIQFSSGGSQFYAGKGLDNTKFHACIAGAVSGAYHTRALAEQYGVPVILHTDHCSKNLLPWLDGMLDADERYFELYGEPLFSSHMIDLSEEPLEENIETCKQYLERMAKINCGLEMELGITGGEEDGVNNEDVDQEDLYSKPDEIWQVYQTLSSVPNGMFTIAAAFGNVHGVYQPGNVKLKPDILDAAQKYIADKLDGKAGDKPVKFVFHGGSGSDLTDIREAIGYGVIKMNIDTDTQWAYWNGIRGFEAKYTDFLQTQIGNPDGKDKPNKKYYDPRACMRAAETSTKDRLGQCFEDLQSKGSLGLGPAGEPENVLGPRRGGLPV
jgi:fructose-bisphosphate aldolase class II